LHREEYYTALLENEQAELNV